ncbi:phage transcriptional regulator AlpA [Burkholderia pseudomallei]|nr:phage transcriptional regulator AlpA [Burkholderia pseudomallei]CAJ5537498.1 phage transcriptional regulator AlpA [Burkholderia pseudomallei]CAJ7426432.1 phage transcriptional regulator AlpA [Burkholderia pseudomallei]CAJ7818716.1 phage transcriptional regulator AlpA [Burkholderia pseudomallei]
MRKHIDTLPLVGFSRWHQIAPFLGVSRETWRKRCLEGRAPQPIQLTQRCTVWRNEEVHRWLADPIGYRAGTSEAGR